MTSAIADPTLTLHDSRTVVASNDDWGGSLAIAASQSFTFQRVGAFPLTSGSKDAALIQTIEGPHTVHASTKSESGSVLVEVYDTSERRPVARLVNLSVRTQAGTGASAVITGFVIEGVDAKQVLLRAIGPALAGFGIEGVLGNPRLSLYDNSGAKLYTNDDWGSFPSPTQLARATSLAGAFSLGNSTRDAAAVLWLVPGSYTLEVTGADARPGVVVAEVYEVP